MRFLPRDRYMVVVLVPDMEPFETPYTFIFKIQAEKCCHELNMIAMSHGKHWYEVRRIEIRRTV